MPVAALISEAVFRFRDGVPRMGSVAVVVVVVVMAACWLSNTGGTGGR
jgi:hypothetical protein